jgi:microtubule-associated protein-like 6
MHHVYGYRSQDVRSNLWYTSGVSEFVYHSAAVGIVYNSTTHKQRYNLTHGRHIISLAAYPKAALVATGRCDAINEWRWVLVSAAVSLIASPA